MRKLQHTHVTKNTLRTWPKAAKTKMCTYQGEGVVGCVKHWVDNNQEGPGKNFHWGCVCVRVCVCTYVSVCVHA
jgi:hypothetical protein